MAGTPTSSAARSATWWYDPRIRAIIYQALFLVALIALGWYLVSNTVENLRIRGIRSGFDFLGDRSGLPISDSINHWEPEYTFGYAYITGILNTLRVAVLGLVLATVLGTIVGVSRLSKNWLVAKLASVYVELLRNIPLLLQLFLIYALIGNLLPEQRDAMVIGSGFFLSKSGLQFPLLQLEFAHLATLVALLAGVALTIVWNIRAKRRQYETGTAPPRLLPSLGLIILLPLVVFLALGAPAQFDIAVKGPFRFVGGGALAPEFIALLVGLVLYTSSFIAEIVRSGILAVSYGQTEAASALGFTRGQSLRLVLLPQALRVIIPPMTSQYLNLIKNSSLAAAVGYPDVVQIAQITMNQTSRILECVLMIMAVYLTISLSISFYMNAFNRRIALKER